MIVCIGDIVSVDNHTETIIGLANGFLSERDRVLLSDGQWVEDTDVQGVIGHCIGPYDIGPDGVQVRFFPLDNR